MDEKITIRTELLDALNNGISNRETSFVTINKATTEEKANGEVKPNELVGDLFQAKDVCGEIGSEGDSTIAGCINTLASEIAAFVDGVVGVDEADVSGLRDETAEEDDSGGHNGGGWYGPSTPTTPVDTPVETPTENPDEEEEEDDEDDEGEEVTVTPIVIDPATLATEFTQGGDDTSTETGTSDGIGTISITETDVQITNGQGEVIGTATEGQYKVYEQTTDEQGNVIAVRISKDGE